MRQSRSLLRCREMYEAWVETIVGRCPEAIKNQRYLIKCIHMNNQLSLIKDTYYFGLKTGSYNGFIIGFISGCCINKIFDYVYKIYQK